ncbi:hypothetical protein TELCIR_19823, partial [Teladorsagia circumcincta]
MEPDDPVEPGDSSDGSCCGTGGDPGWRDVPGATHGGGPRGIPRGTPVEYDDVPSCIASGSSADAHRDALGCATHSTTTFDNKLVALEGDLAE